MASSLISSSHHIDFDSVFSMEDASLAPVFEYLIITGDGVVVSTIGGTAVEISESVFAATFELPSDGLTDLSDVPKNIVFDARSLFSDSKEQELKIEYRLLHDILAKTIYVKAGSFDAVTCDRFMLMTAITYDVKINWSNMLFGVLKAMVTPGSRQAKGFAIQIGVVLSNIPGLELGEPRAFPPPRVLNEKTVHRFVHINEQVGMEKTAVSPSVKKTPKKRAVSKKRPVDSDSEVAPIVKKKRTTKGKPATTGLEAVPLQPIEPTANVPDEQPSKPKRKSQKRKRRLVLDDVDETSESAAEQPAARTATGVQETSADVPVATQPADDPDAIIEQILTQLDTDAATKGDDQPTAQAKDSILWFDLPFELAQQDAEGLLSSDIDEEFIADQPTIPLFPVEGDQPQVSGNSKPVTEEHMSIDDILMQISEEMMLPSVTAAEITKIRLGESIRIPGVQERDLFYASLPRISIHAQVSGNSKPVTEEHMSIDDILMQISEEMMLPSVTAAEITKIRLGESIRIPGVQERDLFYASLPRISIHDKGKEILVEDEPVRGNPARETVELICGDVDFLVQFRDRVMEDVVQFFHSFSLNKLPDFDGLNALKAKESLMLEWAGTDSLETAVRRRVYILAKYNEMLLRKFLESHRKYHVPGQPWTATASKIIDLLYVAHSKSLEDLIAQQKEQGIPIEQPCTSTYLDTSIGSGAVLAQFYYMAKSKCWVRPMVLIDGVWTPIQGNDFWKSSCRLSLFVNKRQVPASVVEEDFVPHGCLIEPFQYWGAAPSLIKTWGWARVCTEVIRYGMFGCLRPVLEDICRDIVVSNLSVERIPAGFRRIFRQGMDSNSFVNSFVQLDSVDIKSLQEFESTSSDGSTVYRSPSPILQKDDSFDQEELLYIVESPESSPCIPSNKSLQVRPVILKCFLIPMIFAWMTLRRLGLRSQLLLLISLLFWMI
ncbi:hypothetical protein F511_14098 [Dorcoceras hygrometricum]|uniref:Uncharacterized protein n=1 Tax=Dorcoceras hygrometricum TaxID=472368 RepID=A0A2Z7CNA0_9LAMI|nr:hypothetical protein F511_14098 [Dorcoceras hygrometricum]